MYENINLTQDIHSDLPERAVVVQADDSRLSIDLLTEYCRDNEIDLNGVDDNVFLNAVDMLHDYRNVSSEPFAFWLD